MPKVNTPKTATSTKTTHGKTTARVVTAQVTPVTGNASQVGPHAALGLLASEPSPAKRWPKGLADPSELSLAATDEQSVYFEIDQENPERWQWVREDLNEPAKELAEEIENLEGEILGFEGKIRGIDFPNLVQGSGEDLDVNEDRLEGLAKDLKSKKPSESIKECIELCDQLGAKWGKLKTLQEKIKEREDDGYMPDVYLSHIWPLPDHESAQTYADRLAAYDAAGGLNCVEVIEDTENSKTYLVVTGGGMDMTDRIVGGYVGAGLCPPVTLAESFASKFTGRNIDSYSRSGDGMWATAYLHEACLRSLSHRIHIADRAMGQIAESLVDLGWPSESAEEELIRQADLRRAKKLGEAEGKGASLNPLGSMEQSLEAWNEVLDSKTKAAIAFLKDAIRHAQAQDSTITGIHAAGEHQGDGGTAWYLYWQHGAEGSGQTEGHLIEEEDEIRLPEGFSAVFGIHRWHLGEAIEETVKKPRKAGTLNFVLEL